MKTKENTYDCIVIGSGISGLTTAALLSKVFKKSVLVLEQHFVIGGQTHEFKRKKYHWDTGVHYVGEMEKGLLPRQLFDFITDGKLKWGKMTHEFEHFNYPSFSFKQPSNKTEFENRLIAQFPQEHLAIKQYFIDLSKVNKWILLYMSRKIVPKFLSSISGMLFNKTESLALSTTKTYFDDNFKSEELKALLTSTWFDYGLPPAQSAFVMHALVVNSFLNGGYYPIGGSKEIAKNIIPIIERNGGKVLKNRQVTALLTTHNKAIGVQVKHRDKNETWYAKNTISSIGAINTYKNLIPNSTNKHILSDLKSLGEGYGTLTVYLGLKKDPKELKIKGENKWFFSTLNHDSIINQTFNISDPAFNFAFLSFPSQKNPRATAHTAEIITIVPYVVFKKWEKQKWLKRDEEYYHLKSQIATALLEFVEREIPGFNALIDYQEVSTALTTKHFTKWDKGAFYGIPATPDKFKCRHLTPKTSIQNFWLTGTDISTLGIMGAAMGGVLTAGISNGVLGFFKIMKKIKQ